MVPKKLAELKNIKTIMGTQVLEINLENQTELAEFMKKLLLKLGNCKSKATNEEKKEILNSLQPVNANNLGLLSIASLLKDLTKVNTNAAPPMKAALKKDSESIFLIMIPNKLGELNVESVMGTQVLEIDLKNQPELANFLKKFLLKLANSKKN